jgi:teichuronic acid biosynthesis glycosyltransferase TuaC
LELQTHSNHSDNLNSISEIGNGKLIRVLFVCSGNSNNGIGIIVQNQGQSLINHSIQVEYFPIIGKGIKGYIQNIFLLKQHLKKNKYDIVHAHYSFSAFVASLAGCRPLIVSLMGSDTYMNSIFRIFTQIFNFLFWDDVIVKSEKMKKILHLKKAHLIPNGVDTERFSPMEKQIARKSIDYAGKEKLVVFVADPSRYEKNFDLAQQTVTQLNYSNVELLPVYNVPNDEIPYYMNAADVLLLTSRWEGSVNVVKEAMACNLPVVSTDVGDVKQNTFGLTGYYTTKPDKIELAEKLKLAVEIEKSEIRGRERLIELKLDSASIAKNLIKIYENILGYN